MSEVCTHCVECVTSVFAPVKMSSPLPLPLGEVHKVCNTIYVVAVCVNFHSLYLCFGCRVSYAKVILKT